MSDGTTPARRRRKGRDPCSAHRRDGRPCQARAIPGGKVCPCHGGSAPQVRLAAGRNVRVLRLIAASEELEKLEQGTARWRHALYRAVDAEQELRQYEADIDLIALMKIELRDPSSPAVVASLLEVARERLEGRPWNSPVSR